MKEIRAFLHQSRERVAALCALSERHAALSPVSYQHTDTADGFAAAEMSAEIARDREQDVDEIINFCNAVDAENSSELEAAILYLQNRTSPFDLVEHDTDDADFAPANDVSRPYPAHGASHGVRADARPAPAPTGPQAGERAGSDRFGFAETSLFHAGQDWIALDERLLGKAPML